ncbi:DUF805 domain-containing protein [Phenylobacterium sp.]|uniref:DUF805 domain-containing protein n=1 Tax=Phenylobacterium sp. TaxID=1871053 RepID=UPI003424424F
MADLGLAVAFLGSAIPSLAVQFRRLHDIDRSAWWVLLNLIPLLGALVLFVFHLLPGTPGPNRFVRRRARPGLPRCSPDRPQGLRRCPGDSAREPR